MDPDLEKYHAGDKLKFKTMLKIRLEEFFNKCHSPDTGQFCEIHFTTQRMPLANVKQGMYVAFGGKWRKVKGVISFVDAADAGQWHSGAEVSMPTSFLAFEDGSVSNHRPPNQITEVKIEDPNDSTIPDSTPEPKRESSKSGLRNHYTREQYDSMKELWEKTVGSPYPHTYSSRVEEFVNDCHEPGGSSEGGRFCSPVGNRLVSARPTAKRLDPNIHMGPAMDVSLITDDMLKDKKTGPGLVSRQAAVPGFEDLAGRTDREVLEEITDRMTDNLLETVTLVMENSPKEAEATADWYPWANGYMTELAKANGLDPKGVLAATAALSSSAPWESNVPWAIFLTENLAKGKASKGENQLVDARWAVAAFINETAAGHNPDPEAFAGMIGKKLSALSDKEVALALRGKHDASGTYNPKTGKFSKGEVRQLGEEVHAGLGKKNLGTIPQTQGNIAKAVSVLRNPTDENIDKAIGSQNKVRSFYQNLRDPLDSQYEDVTVDTHSFGIVNGMPWTISSRFIASGTSNVVSSPGNAETGALGTYPLAVEAHRRVADTVNERYGTNYTPNQIQSISWEAWKDRYPPSIRDNKQMQTSIELARSARARGEIGETVMRARIDAARTQAGGPTIEQLIEQYRREG